MPVRSPRVPVALAMLLAATSLGGCVTANLSAMMGADGAGVGTPASSTVVGGLYGGSDGFDTSTVSRKHLDVPYASSSAAQKLDIYLPETGRRPYPVILAIHGGGFRQGDKADGQIEPMLAGLARGYAVVSINYRLSNESIWPAQINDAKAAVRFLRANAATYSIDPDRIAAWGDSAGGTLAALLGTSGGVASLSDPSQGNAEQSDTVQAAVDWFGPIDFSTMDGQSVTNGNGSRNRTAANSPESELFGGPLSTVLDRVRAADPTTYITADDPPFLIEHGTKDSTIPVQQSVLFAEALGRVLGTDRVTLRLLTGADHLDPAFVTADNIAFVLDWLDANVK